MPALPDRLDLVLAALALVVAVGLRPWRAAVPPAAALAWWALLPVLWNSDRLTAQPLIQPLAGSCLLMLMLGWPLTVLLLVPVAGIGWLLAGGALISPKIRGWWGRKPIQLPD